jgi:hypothetical protein
MKKVIGVLVALTVCAMAAQAWDRATYNVSALGVENISNPSGSAIGIADNIAMTGDLTVTGTVTASTIVGSATNIAAGTTLAAVNGAAVTNLNASNIASGNLAFNRVTNALAGVSAFTGVITNGIGLEYTNRFCIYQGLITNVYITGP